MNAQIKPGTVKLLLILVVLIIFIVPFFFIIQPQLEKNTALVNNISELEERKTFLNQLASQSKEYQESLADFEDANEELFDKFPSELPQEISIMFIHNTEQAIPIKLQSVTFGEDVAAQIVSDDEQKQIDEIEEMTGDVTQDEVIEENTTTVSLGGGLSGIATETQFSFSAGYREYKDFLKYILEYKDRIVITKSSATYSSELDSVSGTLALVQYAITGEDREPVKFTAPVIIQGTSNIFMQATGSSSDSDTVERTDFFLMLSPPDADVDAKIIGRAQDPTEASYLKSDANSKQEITITFEGENGSYSATYEIGKETYDEPVEFTKDGTIIFEIISSQRVGNHDKVSAEMNIINHTDTTVTVSVVDDDSENPRVDITGRTGAMIIN